MRKVALAATLALLIAGASVAESAPHGAVTDYGPRSYKKLSPKLVVPWIGNRDKIKVDARLVDNVRYIKKHYKLFVFAGRGALSGHGAQVWFVCGPKVEDKPVCQKRIRRASRVLQKSPAIIYARQSVATLMVAWQSSCGRPDDVIKLVPPCKWVKRFRN